MNTLEKDISLVMRVYVDKLEWAYPSEVLRDVSKILWRYSVTLYGTTLKGTWMKSFLAWDPEGYVEKALNTCISFLMEPDRYPGRVLVHLGL